MYKEDSLIFENENKDILIGTVNNYSFNNTLILPSSVKTIKNFADFSGKGITLIIPSSVEKITKEAFYNSSFDKVIFEEGFKKIDEFAFSYTFIEEFVLPESLKTIASNAFYLSDVTKINLENVEYIGKNAFNESDIEHVVLSEKLNILRDGAFEDCPNLKSVEYNSPVNIPNSAFARCKNLKNFKINSNITAILSNAFRNCFLLEKIDFPHSLRSIDEFAFSGCTSLKEIFIPNSVRSIGDAAFAYCGNLKNIILEDRNIKGIEVKTAAFKSTGVHSFTFPAFPLEIQEGIFEECENLEEIIIKAPISVIPYDFAKNCKNLTKVTFPNTVHIVGAFAFAGTNIEEINKQFKNVTTFCNHAFENCQNLKFAFFEQEVTLHNSIFKDCNKLSHVIFTNKLHVLNQAMPFEGINKTVTIYAPLLENRNAITPEIKHCYCEDKTIFQDEILSSLPFRKASQIIPKLEEVPEYVP